MYNALMLPYIDKSDETYLYIPTLFPFREYIIGGEAAYAEFLRKYKKWLSIFTTAVPVLGAIEGVWLSHADGGAFLSANYLLCVFGPQVIISLLILGEIQRIGLKQKIDRGPKLIRIMRILVNASDFTKTHLLMNSEKKYDSVMSLTYSRYEPYAFVIYPIIILYLGILNFRHGHLSEAMVITNFIMMLYGCTFLGKIGLALYRLHRRPSVE